MSPEQRDITAYLTPASDIYSLGLVLFELLTGRIYKNLRPGTSLPSLRGDAPEWVVELVGKMLADDPRKRPWDGAELVDLIQKSDITTSKISTIGQTSAINLESSRISDQPRLNRQEEAKKLLKEAKDEYELQMIRILLCTQAIELDPIFCPGVCFAGCDCTSKKNNFDQAILDLNKAIELDPTNSQGIF